MDSSIAQLSAIEKDYIMNGPITRFGVSPTELNTFIHVANQKKEAINDLQDFVIPDLPQCKIKDKEIKRK